MIVHKSIMLGRRSAAGVLLRPWYRKLQKPRLSFMSNTRLSLASDGRKSKPAKRYGRHFARFAARMRKPPSCVSRPYNLLFWAKKLRFAWSLDDGMAKSLSTESKDWSLAKAWFLDFGTSMDQPLFINARNLNTRKWSARTFQERMHSSFRLWT